MFVMPMPPIVAGCCIALPKLTPFFLECFQSILVYALRSFYENAGSCTGVLSFKLFVNAPFVFLLCFRLLFAVVVASVPASPLRCIMSFGKNDALFMLDATCDARV